MRDTATERSELFQSGCSTPECGVVCDVSPDWGRPPWTTIPAQFAIKVVVQVGGSSRRGMLSGMEHVSGDRWIVEN
jgi:hypothetical protein